MTVTSLKLSTIKFNAPIVPVPFKRAAGFGRRFNPPDYSNFKSQLGLFAKHAMDGREPLTGKIKLYAEIYRNIKPDSLNFGDWDNHAKAISDDLNGICYLDDRQIVDGHIKLFKGEPHIYIELEVIS